MPLEVLAGGSLPDSPSTDSCCRLMPKLIAWRTFGSFSGAFVVLNHRPTTLLSVKYGVDDWSRWRCSVLLDR